MRADLDARSAQLHHLLLHDDAITREDVEALVRSHYPQGGWIGPDAISLEFEVQMTGPWRVPPELRADLDAPAWATWAYLVLVPQQREGELPESLAGLDPILDAYPYAVPRDKELATLNFLRACARRIGGAVHLAGTAVVLTPDPASAVDLMVYAPRFLAVDEFLAAVPGASLDGRTRRSWSASIELRDGGSLQVVSDLHPVPPLAIAGLDWVRPGARGYEIRWRPPSDDFPRGGRLSPGERRIRRRAAQLVEEVAGIIAERTQGVAVDDDGFLVAL